MFFVILNESHRSKEQLSKQLRQCAEKMKAKKDNVAKEESEGKRLDNLMGEIKSFGRFGPPCIVEIAFDVL